MKTTYLIGAIFFSLVYLRLLVSEIMHSYNATVNKLVYKPDNWNMGLIMFFVSMSWALYFS